MNSEVDWVNLVRQTLSAIGVEKPEELIPDGEVARAVAIDLRVNMYMGGDLSEVTLKTTASWLRTNKIPEDTELEKKVTAIANEIYFDDNFREKVFRPLYESDLKRKRSDSER